MKRLPQFTITLGCRVTPDQSKAVERAAKQAGLTVSQWIRLLILKATRKDASQ